MERKLDAEMYYQVLDIDSEAVDLGWKQLLVIGHSSQQKLNDYATVLDRFVQQRISGMSDVEEIWDALNNPAPSVQLVPFFGQAGYFAITAPFSITDSLSRSRGYIDISDSTRIPWS